jgi:hypothetical protein
VVNYKFSLQAGENRYLYRKKCTEN